MKTNLEIVREAVIAAVPEIMELKFGCRFIDEDKSVHTIVRRNDVFDRVGAGKNEIYTDKTGNQYYSDYYVEEREILGRPILAQDVLQIMPHDWMLKGSGGKHEFIYMKDYGTMKFENKYFIWQKGGLEMQTPEFLDFLAGLLAK